MGEQNNTHRVIFKRERILPAVVEIANNIHSILFYAVDIYPALLGRQNILSATEIKGHITWCYFSSHIFFLVGAYL